MIRLWGEITESKKVGKAKSDGPMPIFLYDIKVKVKGPFTKTMALAGKVKDKEIAVQRETPFPKEFEKGRRIVLDAKESVPIVVPLRTDNPIVEMKNGAGEARVHVAVLDKKIPEIKIETKGAKAEWKKKPALPKTGALWAEGILAISADSDFEQGMHTVTLSLGSDKKGDAGPPTPQPISIMVSDTHDAPCKRYRYDIDRDGFEEVIIENPWVRAVGSARYGARVLAFENLASGMNPISSTGGAGYTGRFDRGGLAHWHRPAAWWSNDSQMENVPAADGKPTAGPDALMAFRGPVSGADGLTIDYTLALTPDGPIGLGRTTYHYAGKKSDGKAENKDDAAEKDEVTVGYQIPIPIAFGRESELCKNARMKGITFHVPGARRMDRRRYEPLEDYWHDSGWSESFGLTSGYIAAEDEAGGSAFVILCDAHQLLTVTIIDGLLTPVLRPAFRTARLGKDEATTTAYILAVGDAVAASHDGVALLTLGRTIGKQTPIHILARGRWGESDEIRARVRGGAQVRMHRQYVNGVGEYWTGTAHVELKKGAAVDVAVHVGEAKFSLSATR